MTTWFSTSNGCKSWPLLSAAAPIRSSAGRCPVGLSLPGRLLNALGLGAAAAATASGQRLSKKDSLKKIIIMHNEQVRRVSSS
jgi:hypothetical protein